MIKKLFYSLLLMVVAFNANAQSIGLIGGFTNWASDVVMTTSDNVTYTITGYTFLTNTEGKFRQDSAWTNSWGSTAFPTGVGAAGGANIPIAAGTYNITFNFTTKDYSFVAVSTGFDAIGFYGGFNSWATPSTAMVTANGTTYLKTDFHFTADGVKFIKDNNTSLTWGSTAFPSGTATAGGATIPLTAGFYNVDFDKTTLGYNFQQVPVSIIGTGVDPVATTTDLFLTSTDGGVTFHDTNIQLYAGIVKFRANSSYDTNWSSTAFPTGTGVQTGSGNDIPTQPGIYTIDFNRMTGVYTFTLTTSTVDAVTVGGTAMTTADGTSYKIDDFYVDTPTALTFNNTTAAQVYGGTAYPAGTATLNGAGVNVPAGYYNITYNSTTKAYSFTVTPVSIIGSATPGGWATDTAMTSSDNGINFTLSNVTLTAGELKFRSNNDWEHKAWGSTSWPSGTADITPGSSNIPAAAGVYNATFNRTTGDFSFTTLATNNFSGKTFAVSPNPVSDMFTITGDFATAQVYTISGQLVKTFTNTANLSISDLSAGIYLVKIADANNNQETIKLVKQ